MKETEFHQLADAALESLAGALEAADASGLLEAELQGGTLSIRLPSGKEYIISKHAPTQQLWLASPVSGGLHFSYDGEWKLPDGRTLSGILSQELRAAGIEARF